jgi:hypothetical protein
MNDRIRPRFDSDPLGREGADRPEQQDVEVDDSIKDEAPRNLADLVFGQATRTPEKSDKEPAAVDSDKSEIGRKVLEEIGAYDSEEVSTDQYVSKEVPLRMQELDGELHQDAMNEVSEEPMEILLSKKREAMGAGEDTAQEEQPEIGESKFVETDNLPEGSGVSPVSSSSSFDPSQADDWDDDDGLPGLKSFYGPAIKLAAIFALFLAILLILLSLIF